MTCTCTFGFGEECGACGDGCQGKACQVAVDSPQSHGPTMAQIIRLTNHQPPPSTPPRTSVMQPRHIDFLG